LYDLRYRHDYARVRIPAYLEPEEFKLSWSLPRGTKDKDPTCSNEAGLGIRHSANGHMPVLESKIRLCHYQTWRGYGGSPHGESIAKFQQWPKHADGEEATMRRATVVSATVPEARTQKGLHDQGQSYDPRQAQRRQR
jgi:hypothetical protein